MDAREPTASRRRRWLRWVIAVAAITCGIVWFRHVQEPYRETQKLHNLIQSLASRCPPDMEQTQWKIAVDWTNNLNGNSLVWGFKDGAAIRKHRQEIEARLQREVDMDTINWIWDRYAELCPAGSRYQQWRQVMLDEIAKISRSR
ncbi:hypothetical protein [Neorhodopirellula pilleata]|uniref:Uncharacterized protein n=1 Tax=Neorhodopirellula pilleata TaxID=2714738 RepID=A0A5C5YUD6_9BACT|nr:hypothetical protein [Neorhodopirellula pilleata]TWT78594.1 hypothetical protein Pla100_63000 [Neorhodopirellula pilleata]